MNNTYTFKLIKEKSQIKVLITKSLGQLTSPQDGMWESFRNQGDSYVIIQQEKEIGYMALHLEHGLIQFYILPEVQKDAQMIFSQILKELKVIKGMVGTHNPVFLSTALHFQKSIEVDTFLFTPTEKDSPVENRGELIQAKTEDLVNLIPFYQHCIGAPEQWLVIYLGDLVSKGEIFFLKKGKTFLGACEVRKSITNPKVADIGMVVSPDNRKQGYGSYLLSQAKILALANKRMPICSCECNNIGSKKSIEKAGFISVHRLLKMSF